MSKLYVSISHTHSYINEASSMKKPLIPPRASGAPLTMAALLVEVEVPEEEDDELLPLGPALSSSLRILKVRPVIWAPV
jgi:hypothetical protein